MRKRISVFHAIAALSLSMSLSIGLGSALAGVETSTKIGHYKIRGKSASDIVRYMEKAGPVVDGTHALASIEQNFSLKGQFVQTNKCRVEGFGIVANFKITLPKLRTKRGVSARTLQNFAAFYRKAHMHELTHRKIYLGCARRIDQRVRALRPQRTCSDLGKRIATIMKRESRTCEAKHAAFDRKESRRVGRSPLMRQAVKEIRRPQKRRSGLSSLDRLMDRRIGER